MVIRFKLLNSNPAKQPGGGGDGVVRLGPHQEGGLPGMEAQPRVTSLWKAVATPPCTAAEASRSTNMMVLDS